ncbi:electron transport complex subunit E [Candidatus Venteria ishoeyi]|uniref:Ion-translocating oxidoreductase complex subunit E n=1 Tax=Candidatus Venteria ishoeyi TaxID=1899563 RepID=A0A1H6FB94_9GAMM|nr:electron transport complex subunit E [Candidatus Venteria ishoeyi]MDM8547316.1 electron transport complex subunit E [Candidatus Venteria ishoeyi]SEH07380.1 Electron transport complex protein RnfE [Candidatus Venteria ishoeyi]
MDTYRKIILEGFWGNNVGLVQLLGLCPLLAVTGTAMNGLGLGIATTLILLSSNGIISLIRNWIPGEIRLPVFVLVIASSVTAVEALMQAFYYDLYLVLGIFIPLIVTNCAVIGRAEAFAVKNPLNKSLVDALSMGLGFTVVLVLLGAMRELLGQGTLFTGAELMFGGVDWTITVFEHYQGFLLAMLPPGAFIGLGLLIVLKNWIDRKIMQTQTKAVPVAFVSMEKTNP